MTVAHLLARSLLIALSFSAAVLAQPRAPLLPIDAGALKTIRRHVAATMNEYGIPALSLSVQFRGARWAEAYGQTDVENATQARVTSVYRLASVSKVLTATAVMQLVERGKLKLDAPIQCYVSEYPRKPYVVTIRQLLNHTSGVRHYKSDDDDTDPEVNNTRRIERSRRRLRSSGKILFSKSRAQDSCTAHTDIRCLAAQWRQPQA